MTAVLDRALALAADRLDGTADVTRPQRRRIVERFPTALDVAARFERSTVRTPALTLVAERLQQALAAHSGRLVVSIAPQEGKSTLLRWQCVRALVENPQRRLVYASFAHSLAQESGGAVRDTIAIYGEQLGLALDPGRRAEGDWRLAGHRGGMYSVGVGGALTGRPADVMVIDDPLRNQQDADSVLIRDKLWSWWTSVARTRLAPGAPVIVVQTRWAEDDLAGRLVDEGWPIVNIPALADGQTLDALDRAPGEWLISSRGRTVAEWEETRAAVGERVFAAMYQGRPAPLEGGIFRREWVDNHRVAELPADVDQTVVAVDPAETGMGDAAGILVGHRARSGHTYTSADLSGQLTQAQWGRKVCLTAVRVSAHSIAQERNLGMSRVLPDAWQVIRRQAVALKRARGNVAAALGALAIAGDTVAADRAQLDEIAPLVTAILERPSTRPCRVSMINPRVSKQARAEGITGYYELGVTHHVGRLPQLEHEMFTWQPGQPSPNRLDTLALLLTQLDTYSAQKGRRARTDTPRTRTTVPSSTPSVYRPGFR